MALSVQTANAKLSFLVPHQEELLRCVNSSNVLSSSNIGPLLCKMPLDPKVQNLIDRGQNIFESSL